jgi:hypothetical protein
MNLAILTSLAGTAILLFASCTRRPPSLSDPTAAARAPIGGTCATDADCEVGATCDLDDPGGQCTKKCTTSAECGAGNVCEANEKECFQACKSQADCTRPGYRCLGTAPGMFCDVPEEDEKH